MMVSRDVFCQPNEATSNDNSLCQHTFKVIILPWFFGYFVIVNVPYKKAIPRKSK